MILATAYGRLMTAAAIHREFGISYPTLAKWAERDWIQKTGGVRSPRYSRDEIIRLLALGENWRGEVVRRRGMPRKGRRPRA